MMMALIILLRGDCSVTRFNDKSAVRYMNSVIVCPLCGEYHSVYAVGVIECKLYKCRYCDKLFNVKRDFRKYGGFGLWYFSTWEL